jgi:apyrase
VLDAGSTGTRVHVFSYAVDPRSSYATLQLPEPKLKVEPGLSSYAADAAGAGASLQPLLEFAGQHVPAQQQAQTPVYLMATAGLRLLPSTAADAILNQCRGKLLASSFLFKPEWASIISGTSEGLYAWVAANYAAGNLQVRLLCKDTASCRGSAMQGYTCKETQCSGSCQSPLSAAAVLRQICYLRRSSG